MALNIPNADSRPLPPRDLFSWNQIKSSHFIWVRVWQAIHQHCLWPSRQTALYCGLRTHNIALIKTDTHRRNEWNQRPVFAEDGVWDKVFETKERMLVSMVLCVIKKCHSNVAGALLGLCVDLRHTDGWNTVMKDSSVTKDHEMTYLHDQSPGEPSTPKANNQ